MLQRFTNAQFREYLYAVATALLAFAVGYEWIAADKLPLWLGLAAALFAIGATGTAAVKVHQQRRDGTLP